MRAVIAAVLGIPQLPVQILALMDGRVHELLQQLSAVENVGGGCAEQLVEDVLARRQSKPHRASSWGLFIRTSPGLSRPIVGGAPPDRPGQVCR